MKRTAPPRRVAGRLGDAKQIALDAEFRDLPPPLSAEEQSRLEAVLLREGCREPLVVWPLGQRQVLVTGYAQFDVIQRYRLPFRVVAKTFATREEVRLFIIQDQLVRRSLTRLAVSYLRGLRYRNEKQPHGGDRKSASAQRRVLGKTADALGEMFGVSAATLRRDAEVATAVNQVATTCGADAKTVLLGVGNRLGREGVLALAELPAKEQKKVFWQLRDGKRPDPSWRGADHAPTLTLPAAPAALVDALLRRRGREFAVQVWQFLGTALENSPAKGAETSF